jgi:hypothetical protein
MQTTNFSETGTYPAVVGGHSSNAFNTQHKSQQNSDIISAMLMFSVNKNLMIPSVSTY